MMRKLLIRSSIWSPISGFVRIATSRKRSATTNTSQAAVVMQDSAGKESGVPFGILMTRRAIWKYRATFPIRCWHHSTLRILAEEVRNFPRRIRATLKSAYIRFGYTLPTYLTFDYRESRGQGYEFASACNRDIKKLHRENPCAGSLELELAAAAYQAGIRLGHSQVSQRKRQHC